MFIFKSGFKGELLVRFGQSGVFFRNVSFGHNDFRAVVDSEPADVDDMVNMFQLLLPGLDAGEDHSHLRLADHGWDLQTEIKGAAQEDDEAIT